VALVGDAVLGLVAVDHQRVTQLEEGHPIDLRLVDIIDNRVGRGHGVKETTIHRVDAADIDGDGSDEVLLLDDLRHRVTALANANGQLTPLISWPVFEDKQYPYGDDTEHVVREPRSIIGVDLDGDHQRDLAMLCHDRLVLYLAREQP
jgi:hypothetical protein